MVTAPTITIRMAITMATIGRLMKKLDMSQLPFAIESAVFGFHNSAISYLLKTFDDDEFSRFYAALNDPHRANTIANLDGSQVHLVIAVYHRALVGSLQFRHRALRYQQRPLHSVGGGAYSPKLTRPQDIVRIRKRRNDPNASGRDVHLAIGVENLSLSADRRCRPPISVREEERQTSLLPGCWR